jgi:ABC-type dipeptide/oligopeptide/nickel transport system ATPase subunit
MQARPLQMVFQDATGALNPRRTIGDSVGQPLLWLAGEAGTFSPVWQSCSLRSACLETARSISQ